MVITDENNPTLNKPTNFQVGGGLEMGNRKFGQEIRHNRRALSVINQSLVSNQAYPIVNKRGLSEKHQFFEKKQADPVHRPITRKFAAQIANTQPPCPQEIKKANPSASNSNGFGDFIFIDEEHKAPKEDHPVPMFLEQPEAMPSETDEMEEVEMEDIVEEPVMDIDSCDAKNPLAVVDYIEDLYAYYRKMECFSCVSPDYMAQQFDINERMRAILIDWLIEVHDKFELMKETLFLTVNIIDRFLSKQSVVRKKLQLVGLVAMLLACKYEEVSVPVVGDLILISDKAYTRKEVLEMAFKEAQKVLKIKPLIWSGKSEKHTKIPSFHDVEQNPDAKFLHICANETIYGVEYKDYPSPKNGILVADMSSNFYSKPVVVSKFGFIYGGAQPSGVTIVIIKKDLIGNDGIYMCVLAFEDLLDQEGLIEVEKKNKKKAEILYNAYDGSNGFYRCPVEKSVRSFMNVPFTLEKSGLEAEFIKEAAKENMVQLKRHKSVGGMCASIYNAMPLAAVEKLVAFMKDFEARLITMEITTQEAMLKAELCNMERMQKREG
ncbi:G2/mitotic-specific cyclin-1-like isoform X3 [Quercus lobata]|uniref:G2/mitotic-specific cyclin-1-like isoform X3 n=1 Tax=Quercus lobata TaxID=97700 RepID=UPI0012478E8E|nr:G2/mitotic-specific cyclin-1-like isoform X3 [Quercus lobata]XP_030975764.1 G2/mitotic-specific cyclin-1-like isoform X3 [Quercus lobata]XP_030975765.1 G2/mitotic-specific cyclin-1-like isoform X3 [Quercus lobata]